MNQQNQPRNNVNTPATTTPKTMVQDATDQIGDYAQRLEGSGKELLTKFQAQAGVAGDKIKAGTSDAVAWVRANPVKSLAIGFGAALLLGKFIFGGAEKAERKYLN